MLLLISVEMLFVMVDIDAFVMVDLILMLFVMVDIDAFCYG